MDELAKLKQLFESIRNVQFVHERIKLHVQIQEVILTLPPQAVYETLVALLKDEHDKVRFYAARLLRQNRVILATEALISVLEIDEDDDIQAEAARALEVFGDTKAVDPLIKILKNPSRETHVRATAAESLDNFNTSDAIEALLFVLVDDYNIQVDLYEAVVASLVKIGDEAINTKLLSILAEVSISDGVLLCIVDALGQLKSKASVSLLLKLLTSHEDPEVRAASAQALGEIGDTSAIPALRIALLDNWSYTRRCASEALRKLSS